MFVGTFSSFPLVCMDHPRSSPNSFMIEHSLAQNLETQREEKGPGVYTLRLSQLFYTINNKPDHKTLSIISYIQRYTFLRKNYFCSSLSIVTFQKIIYVKLSG